MTFVGHLLAADFRRFRSTVAAWMLLVVISTVTEAMHPRVGGSPVLSEWLGVMGPLLWLASAMFTAAIVAGVVQTHTLVGTTAFWFARPIPTRALLVSKVLFLFVVLVAFPVACDVVAMLPYHLPPSRMALVVLQSVGLRFAVVLVLMCPAALTPSLTRFALVCIAVIAGVAVLAALGITAMVASPATDRFGNFMRLQGGGFVYAGERVTDWTPSIVAGLLVIASAFVLLGVQYNTRATLRALVSGLAALAVAIAISWIWPWKVFVPYQSTPEWAHNVPVLTLDPGTAKLDARWSSSRDPWRLVRARAQMSGTPTGWVATESLAGATLQAAGKTFQSPPHGTSNAVGEEKASATGPGEAVLQSVLGVAHVTAGGGFSSTASPVIFVAKQSDVPSLTAPAASYRGEFRVDLTHFQLAGTLPLQAGAVFQDGDFRFEIENVRATPDDDRVALRARISSTRSVFDRRPPFRYLYFLRNPGESRAINGYDFGFRSVNLLGLLGAPWASQAFRVISTNVWFVAPQVRQDLARGQDPLWLTNAHLAIVRVTGEATARRTIDLNDVRIDPNVPVNRRSQ